MGALVAMARAMISRVAGPGAARGALRTAGLATGGGLAAAGIGGLFGGDGDGRRRRRRRRVLTANDRADISFITATLGAPAGKAFAMIVAARV